MTTDDCFSLGMTDDIQRILGNKKLNIVEVRWKMLRMAYTPLEGENVLYMMNAAAKGLS